MVAAETLTAATQRPRAPNGRDYGDTRPRNGPNGPHSPNGPKKIRTIETIRQLRWLQPTTPFSKRSACELPFYYPLAPQVRATLLPPSNTTSAVKAKLTARHCGGDGRGPHGSLEYHQQ